MEPHSLNLLRPKLKQLIDLGYKSDFTIMNNRLYSYDSREYYSYNQITVEDEFKFVENTRTNYKVSLFKIICEGGELGTIVTSSEQVEDSPLYGFLRISKQPHLH